MTLTLERLREAVANDAAIRRVQRLQPVGGPGDKIFPPTYPPPDNEKRTNPAPRHVFETRRINGATVWCVLIDSVQSQANRLEEALKAARGDALAFPVIAVDFSGTEVDDIGGVTTLDAPHRVFDAIIRDSEFNGTRFKETEAGRRLVAAKASNALAVYQLSPTALIFGAWNSTGEGGGLGAKFPRCVVSEIVGVGVAMEFKPDARTGEPREIPSGQRTGSRIDPLGTVRSVRVFKRRGSEDDWTTVESEAEAKQERPVLFSGKKKTGEAGRPALINHGNIRPSVTPLGVSVDYALHTFVLSCAALRRLHFGGNSGVGSPTDLAAQTALAALGLAAATGQDRNGYFLRSRCDLAPDANGSNGFEIVRANGLAEPIEIDFSAACQLVTEAARAAAAGGVPWNADDLVLAPQEKLVRLVSESRRLALQGEAEAGDEDEFGHARS